MNAKQYKDTNYIILADGRAARLLKPTKIHHQQYYNFIVGGKQERVNTRDAKKLVGFEEERTTIIGA
jgi:hypothetical protein